MALSVYLMCPIRKVFCDSPEALLTENLPKPSVSPGRPAESAAMSPREAVSAPAAARKSIASSRLSEMLSIGS